MMENSISQLEQTIRDNAVRAFESDMRVTTSDVIGRHFAMVDGNTQRALHVSITGIVEGNRKRIGDAAVRKFMTTYGNLVAEFPYLQEQQP
jgi:hypothetical protein